MLQRQKTFDSRAGGSKIEHCEEPRHQAIMGHEIASVRVPTFVVLPGAFSSERIRGKTGKVQAAAAAYQTQTSQGARGPTLRGTE